MKHTIIYILCLISSLSFSLNAQDLTSGTGEYTLTDDVTLETTIVVTGDMTINLNGNTLKTTLGRVFNVNSGHTLTIRDVDPMTNVPTGKGVITGGVGDRGGCAYVNGTMILESGTIKDCTTKRSKDYDSEVSGSDVYVHKFTDGCGGAVYIWDGTFIMNGGNIVGCSTEVKGLASIEDADGNKESVRGNGGAVYVYGAGTFNMSAGTIKECEASSGGAVYVSAGSTFNMTGGTIESNKIYGKTHYIDENNNEQIENVNNYGCGVYTSGVFNMSGGEIKNNYPKEMENTIISNYPNEKYDGYIVGGGVFVPVDGKFVMTGGKILGNAAASGGGVCAYGGTLEMDGTSAKISGNYAVGAGNGGGVFLDNCDFIMRNGTISGNKALAVGGAICTNSKVGISFEGVCDISENEALSGGGLSLAGGSTLELNSSGISVRNNVARLNGGGLYMTQGNLTINDCNIIENKAIKGGGIHMFNGELHVKGGNMKQNEAQYGGAIYLGPDPGVTSSDEVGKPSINVTSGNIQNNTATIMGGGINLADGSLTVSGTINVINNSAENGGGISVSNGTVNISSGNISQNIAKFYGGGLYIFNTETTTKQISFNGGTFSKNTVLFGSGGGVSAIGLVNVEMSAIIEDNTANNGGGIYLGQYQASGVVTGGATMNFGNGRIRNNYAQRGRNFYETAYKKDSGTIEGIGGGIFMGNNTKLTFGTATDFGLYGNLADNGADDLFANGDGTTVELPSVASMNLKDYVGPATNLYWAEDYLTNDSDYDYGTKAKDYTENANDDVNRYRYELKNLRVIDKLKFEVDETTKTLENVYVCLALGYDIVYVKLTKVGLLYNDDAKISISYKNADNVFKHYTDVFFTGIENNADVTKTVALPAGKYKFEEDTKWAWRYVDSPTFNPEHTDGYIEISSEKNREITIKNEVKSGYEQGKILEHSHRKVNRMKP